jgi:hypothetical protein
MAGKHIFYVIVLVFLANVLSAQVIRVDSSKMGRGTNEVVIFSKDGGSGSSGSAPSWKEDNVVKLGLLNVASGNIPIYYERRLLPLLSVQAGVGVTVRDFAADVVNMIFTNGEPPYNPYYQYAERKPKVGYYMSIQPKVYTSSDAMDGFWVSPMLEFKRFNFKANMVDQTAISSGDGPVYLTNSFQSEFRNDLDFTLNIGWQWLLDNKVAVEYSMGAGFRRFWEERQNIGDGYNNGYGQSYVNSTRYFNGWRPDFNFCLSVGGFF